MGPSDSSGITVVMQCDAEANVPVSHVTITACYTTDGASSPTVSLPLQAAATVNEMKIDSVHAGYLTCASATAETITPVTTLVAPLHCTPTILGGIGFTYTTA